MRRRHDIHRQYGQVSYLNTFVYVNGIKSGEGSRINKIRMVCRKHLQPAHICQCTPPNAVEIYFQNGTRCPPKTAKNKWKKLLAIKDAKIK